MNTQVSEELRHKAINAVSQYVGTKENCRERHKASIGVVINGKEQHGVGMVFVGVTEKNVEIIIENLDALCTCYTNKFTADSADISIINKTLQIRPRHSLCGKVVIEITAI